jgi:hypothetical protein
VLALAVMAVSFCQLLLAEILPKIPFKETPSVMFWRPQKVGGEERQRSTNHSTLIGWLFDDLKSDGVLCL